MLQDIVWDKGQRVATRVATRSGPGETRMPLFQPTAHLLTCLRSGMTKEDKRGNFPYIDVRLASLTSYHCLGLRV